MKGERLRPAGHKGLCSVALRLAEKVKKYVCLYMLVNTFKLRVYISHKPEEPKSRGGKYKKKYKIKNIYIYIL